MKPHNAVRVVVSTAVIVGALSMLFFTVAQQDAQFYKHVDEVMANPTSWYGKHVQLHGFADHVLRKPDTLEYAFTVKNNGASVPVTYTGVVPDTFKDGTEVVVTGRLAADGFHGESIMAKCPSRYQATDGPSTGGH